jgi:hypothetical protein
MKKALLFLTFLAFNAISTNVYSIDYVSASSGDWDDPNSWTPVGVPTSVSNVTINAGHIIDIDAAAPTCKNLIVNGTINWSTVTTLNVRGNYSLLVGGSETGVAGRLQLSGNSSNVYTCTGTSSPIVHVYFYRSYTIAAGSDINKISATTFFINSGTVITNLGTYRIGTCDARIGTSWINAVNSTLFITKPNFFLNRIFTATASGNSVNLSYPTGNIPATTASTYFNLTLSATTTGTKTLTANTIITNNLAISALNTLNSNNFNLTVTADWTSSGTFTASAGRTVTFNGTAAQDVSNTSGTTTFTGLTIANTAGVTLTSGTYALSEVLTVSDGTFNTGGRPFTMTSTATQTARIAPITGTGAIAGNFTIQRFIDTRDSTWADLSSPVQNATFLDWDNELPAVYYGSFPTQYTYDESADDWSPVTSSGTALTPGQGFEVFLSGDFNYSDFPNTTINTIGVPNQSDQDFSGLISFNSAGSNLVGNPFASSISWSSVFAASSGIMNTIDMYDFTAGNYSTFGLGTEIGSTQGFWVYTTTAAATLIIPESSKTTTSNSSLRSSVQEPYFTLRLSSNDANNTYFHVLKVSVDNSSSDGWDMNDHPYRKSPNKLAPSMYTYVDGKKAVINSFNSSDDDFSMQVAVNAGISGYYKIEANGFDNISDYTCIKLEDKVLNKIIDLSAGEAYSFELSTGDNADRFVVHFSKSGNCRSMAANTSIAADLESQITILPTSEGNSINFNMAEATPATITVTNVIGQHIIEGSSVVAESQTLKIVLPQDFSGMYILKIESSKGVITKKYVRK